MTQTDRVTIRSVQMQDFGLLLAAQKASSNELDALGDDQIMLGLRSGMIEGLVLQAQDRRMLICWQRDGKSALLTTLYREGCPKTFLSDARRLLIRTQDILEGKGVKRIFCGIGILNENFDRLLKLYVRLGFKPDLMRLVKGE